MEEAILAGGCFWCTEALFKRLIGVKEVISGYAGGTLENPTYEEVCSGSTGHVECIKIVFDPKLVSFEKLLKIFFYTHDPTTLNKQGNDVGTQYRSGIFYLIEEQKDKSIEIISQLENDKVYKNKIITTVEKFTNFYEADINHKNYYDINKSSPYCDITITPKINKLIDIFNKEVKEEYK